MLDMLSKNIHLISIKAVFTTLGGISSYNFISQDQLFLLVTAEL